MNLEKVPSIIAVASGKGGVGKTTVATDIARLAADKGISVGLVDADISTPNAPEVVADGDVDLSGQRLSTRDAIVPPVVDGVQLVSQGIVLPDDVPVLRDGSWRAQAIADYIQAVEWGEDTELVVIDTPPGCLVSGTPVWTENGPIPIEEVRPGMRVWTFAGEMSNKPVEMENATPQLREVKGLFDSGEQTVYEAKTRTRTIEGTGDHPVMVATKESRGTYGLEWKGIAELEEGDQVLVSKSLPDGTPSKLPNVGPTTNKGRRPDSVVVPDETTEDLCRLVGYFLGDGALKDLDGDYGVYFSEDDASLIDRYSSILESQFGLEPSINQRGSDRNGVKFGIYRKRLLKLFKQMGLGGGVYGKTVPGWMFQEPVSHREACVEGFLDADGHRRTGTYSDGSNRDGNSNVELANSALAQGIRTLAMSVGKRTSNLRANTMEIPFDHSEPRDVEHSVFDIIPTKVRADGGPSKGSPKFRGSGLIRSLGDDGLPGLNDEYWGFDSVVSVSEKGTKQTWDLNVEGDHNFLADGMLVHNTGEELQVIASEVPITEAYAVTTPHDSSLRDVTKTHEFFNQTGTEHDVIVNMAYIPGPDIADHVSESADLTDLKGVGDAKAEDADALLRDNTERFALFGYDGSVELPFDADVAATVPYTADSGRRREVYGSIVDDAVAAPTEVEQ